MGARGQVGQDVFLGHPTFVLSWDSFSSAINPLLLGDAAHKWRVKASGRSLPRRGRIEWSQGRSHHFGRWSVLNFGRLSFSSACGFLSGVGKMRLGIAPHVVACNDRTNLDHISL